MIVFEQDHIELEYHPESSILEVRWIGVLDGNELATLIREIVEIVNKYAIEGILLDATLVKASQSPAIFDPQVQKNFKQVLMMPTVKRIARVISGYVPYDEGIGNLYLLLTQQNLFSFEFESFNHHYEAIHWLTEVA